MNNKWKDLENAVDLVAAGNLDQAHRIAQQYDGDATSDALHAIIHRREGDFSNSLYWWRRVGAAVPVELVALYGDPSQFTLSVRDNKLAIPQAEVEAQELVALKSHLTNLAAGQAE